MKLHIFVATTQGLVAIQNITTIDDADISSIVSVNGTSTTANISSAYHSFVKQGAGIIQQDFGACSYRMNIAKRIDQGNSWQLAFYLAHAAHSQQILGDGQVNPGDQVICATGEINTTSRAIHHVEEVTLKQSLAAKQITLWRKMKVKTSFLVPHSNAKDINKDLATNTQLINTIEQALLLLPLTASLQALTKTKANTESVKNKSPYRKANFINLAIFIVLVLSVIALFISQNPPPTTPLEETRSNVINKRPAQQTWQILLLSKAPHQINNNLKLAYSLIEKTISEQLIAENFEVADKALLLGAHHITEQALIELNKKEVNLAIRFNLEINQLGSDSKGKWRYELSAHLVDLDSKKRIETHNEFGEFLNDTLNCGQQCLSQWFANNARKLAQDMGAILVVKLNNLPRRYQFELNLKGFLAEELVLIHTELKKLNGFISTNLLEEFSSTEEDWHQTNTRLYVYSSYLPRDELEVALQKSFVKLGLKVNKSHSSVRTLVFVRTNSPYYFYYVFAITLLFSLLLLAYLKNLKRKSSKAPEKVIDLLIEAKDLTGNINESLIKTTVKLVAQAFEDKAYYKAYSLIDKCIHHPSSIGLTNNKLANKKLTKLNEIRANIVQHIHPIKGAVIGQGALAHYYFFNADTLTVGRSIVDPMNSFAIGYKQISRSGKQCIFSRKNNDFYLEDQQSTNGSFFNKSPLTAQQQVKLNEDGQLTLGAGESADNLSLCQLQLKVTSGSSPSLMMQLSTSPMQLVNIKDAKTAWPSMETDLLSRWILLGNEISLSLNIDGIELGQNKDQAKIVAYLTYQNGFYIRPEKGSDKNSVDGSCIEESKVIMINQQIVYDKMPIEVNAVISLGGFEFSLQSTSTQNR